MFISKIVYISIFLVVLKYVFSKIYDTMIYIISNLILYFKRFCKLYIDISYYHYRIAHHVLWYTIYHISLVGAQS